MTQKQLFTTEIEKFKEKYDSFKTELRKLEECGCNLHDSELVRTAYEIQEQLIENIAERFEINTEALEWFIYENHFGEKEYESSWPDCEAVKICNAGDFWDFEKKL